MRHDAIQRIPQQSRVPYIGRTRSTAVVGPPFHSHQFVVIPLEDRPSCLTRPLDGGAPRPPPLPHRLLRLVDDGQPARAVAPGGTCVTRVAAMAWDGDGGRVRGDGVPVELCVRGDRTKSLEAAGRGDGARALSKRRVAAMAYREALRHRREQTDAGARTVARRPERREARRRPAAVPRRELAERRARGLGHVEVY